MQTTAPVGAAALEARHLLDSVDRALATTLDAELGRWVDWDRQTAELVAVLGQFTRGGKRLRPAFAVWGYLAVLDDATRGDPTADGTTERAEIVALGTALELLHAFALIHDDVMDEADTRRGRPSVHATFTSRHPDRNAPSAAIRYGESMAMLAGDLAHVLAERAVLTLPTAVRAAWHEMQLELTLGQSLDVVATAHGRIEPATARRIARLKSGRYSVLRPLELGARLGRRAEPPAWCGEFGEPVGEAFQLRDDLLGTFGYEETTGKPVGDDLREGKPTFLLATARKLLRGSAAQLLDRVGAPNLDDRTVMQMQHLLVDCGARAIVEERIERLADRALEVLATAPVSDDVRNGLDSLAGTAMWRRA